MIRIICRCFTVISLGLIVILPASTLAQTGPAGALEETSPPPHRFGGDPIAFVAHGEIFYAAGNVIKPLAEFIRETMDFLIIPFTHPAMMTR